MLYRELRVFPVPHGRCSCPLSASVMFVSNRPYGALRAFDVSLWRNYVDRDPLSLQMPIGLEIAPLDRVSIKSGQIRDRRSEGLQGTVEMVGVCAGRM